MIRYIRIVLAFVFAILATNAQAEATLTAKNMAISAGSNAELQLVLDGSGITSFQTDVCLSSFLTMTDVRLGDTTTDHQCVFARQADGSYRVMVSSPTLSELKSQVISCTVQAGNVEHTSSKGSLRNTKLVTTQGDRRNIADQTFFVADKAYSLTASLNMTTGTKGMFALKVTSPRQVVNIQADITFDKAIAPDSKDGVTLNAASASDSHAVSSAKQSDGSYRVIVSSVNNKPLPDGNAFTLPFTIDGSGAGREKHVAWDNVIFILNDGSKVYGMPDECSLKIEMVDVPSYKWSKEEYEAQVISYDSRTSNHNEIAGTPAEDANGKQWYDVEYKLTNNSSSWNPQYAPFNNWCTGRGDIYVRREFIYDGGKLPETLFLACGHDDAPCEYYLNGVMVWSKAGGFNEDEYVKLKPSQIALLKLGQRNVLAFHVHQNDGGMFADGGLYTDGTTFGIESPRFVIDAASTGLSGNEGSTKLFDEKTNTKWGFVGLQYVIFHPVEDIYPYAYSITTANDNSEYPGRNPSSWALYGANTDEWPDYGSSEWEKIADVRNDDLMQDVNYTRYDFGLDVTGRKYKYYMWEIRAIRGNDFCQVSEFTLEEDVNPTSVQRQQQEENAPRTIYNLAGQRVEKARKGVYVVNGRKVLY